MAIRTFMSFCTVNAPNSHVRITVNLCKAANAHLSLILVGLASSPPISEYTAVMYENWMAERDAEDKAISNRVDNVTSLLEENGLSYNIDVKYSSYSDIIDYVVSKSCFCDLILLDNSIIKNSFISNPIIESSIFQSTRPILVIPDGITPDLNPKKVVVCWNSRPEAARAILNAIEFVENAEKVDVVIVDPFSTAWKDTAKPGADLAVYLARHGSNISVKILESGGKDTAVVIKQYAKETGADLIVMGAYGHSRLRERIFGGVTQAFLDETSVPVLMAH
ncbi:universal stress protein [Cohaesibacter celericrescens]|uniref:Universal stress protein n=1 Tax=Cohaesibacter celericrescens TaxID=2067669 RepID=A0A2N5XVC5_9HYPH|nr:universal stress protein [Cohaesibacter celericrescens]PLW78461.1 universal stress protein [Cohaesibacter celericrescens]